MSLLQQIHSGRRPAPPRILIYGTEGIGKSTTGAQAPRPIFIQTEDGLDQIDCRSFPLAKRYEEVVKALSALYAEEHDFQTVVIDSLEEWTQARRRYDDLTRALAEGGGDVERLAQDQAWS